MSLRWKKLKAILISLRNGSSLNDGCRAAHLSRVTLWRWRNSDPRIEKLVNRYLENQIGTVEDALYRRAVGYRYEEVTKEREETKLEKKVAKVVIKEVVPDVTACMFFLMNRAPDRWADKRAVVNNTVVNKVENNAFTRLTEDELRGLVSLANRIGQGSS